MEATYPHSPLSAPKVQHSANGNHQNTLKSPQCDSFVNANTVDNLYNHKIALIRLRETVNQEQGSNFTNYFLPKLALMKQIEHGLSNKQFNPKISRSFRQFARVTPDNSFVHIEFPAQSPLCAEWLAELLNELTECPAYAQDEDMAEPSDIALAKAKQLLEEISSYVIDRPDIYPMQERCIAIDFRSPESKSGVLFVIEQDGSGALYRRTENSRGRLRVDDAADLLSEGGNVELKRAGIR